MRVINECRIDFNYKMTPLSPIIAKTIFSNKTETIVADDMLKVEKKVDKEYASSFDILRYTIIISNISDKIVTNIFFQDFLPREVRFIKNSVRINGVKHNCISVIKGFFIDNLKISETTEICFKAIVMPYHCNIAIKNQGNFKYDYIYNVEKPPVRLDKETNETSTNIRDNLFKQFNITDIFSFKCFKNEKVYIEKLSVDVNVIKTKLVNTPVTNTKEHEEKTLNNLVVIGTIEYNIEFIVNSMCYRRCEKLNDIRGFSTNILVPYGIEFCSHKDLDVGIEHYSEIAWLEDELLIYTIALIDI